MNKQLLDQIKQQIAEGKFPKSFQYYAAEGLVIADNANTPHASNDRVVITPEAAQVGWVLSQLQNVYKDHIDYMNKYGFQSLLGHSAADTIEDKGDIFDVLENLVAAAENWAKNNPEIEHTEDEFDGHGP